MWKNKKRQEQEEQNKQNDEQQLGLFRRTTIKELIAPSGIDVSNIDRL